MKQSDIALSIAEKTSLDQKKAEEVVAAFVEVMTEHFIRGEKVVLAEFGSFYITADKQIQFNPSARVKDQID